MALSWERDSGSFRLLESESIPTERSPSELSRWS